MSVASMKNNFNSANNMWTSTTIILTEDTPTEPPKVIHPVKKTLASTAAICANCSVEETPTWRTGPNGIKLCNRCGLYWLRNKSHWPLDGTKIKKQRKTVKKPKPLLIDTLMVPSKHNDTVSDTESESTPKSDIDVAEILLFDLSKDEKTGEEKKEEVKNSDDEGRRCCSHCSTEDTPLWRKGPNGDRLCNRWYDNTQCTNYVSSGVYWRRHSHLRPLENASTAVAGSKPKPPKITTKRASGGSAKHRLSTLTKSAYLVEGRAKSPNVPDEVILRHVEGTGYVHFMDLNPIEYHMQE